jgi:ribosome biogenesis GTPase A
VVDLERAANTLLRDLTSGRLGRISLETPADCAVDPAADSAIDPSA